jgi:GAF domain-containing protein
MRKFLVTVRYEYANPAEKEQARRLLRVNLGWLIILLVGLPLIIYWALDRRSLDTGTVFIPCAMIVAVVVHYLLQRGQLSQARLIFVFNILIAALLGTFPEYRIDTPFVLLLMLPLTAAGVLLPRSILFWISLLLIVTFSVGGIIQLGNEKGPNSLGNASQSIIFTILVVVSIVILNTLMQWTFLSGIEDTQRQQHRTAGLITTSAQIGETLLALSSNSEDLNRAVEQMRDAFGLYHAQIFLTEPDSGMALLQASTGYLGRRMLEESRSRTPDENNPVNLALRRKDPLLILDTEPAPQRSNFLPATRSELLIPLRVGNLLPLGVLDLHGSDRNTFSEYLLDALTTLAYQMAALLYSEQQTKELRTSYEEHDQLLQQIDAGQRELARLNRQLVSATWGTYLEEHQDTAPGFDWKKGNLVRAQAESALLRQTLDSGQSRSEHTEDHEVLSVPIRLRGQTLGAVEFRRSGAMRWSPAAIELVQAVAERLALSLENARLFEQAQNTAQREQVVSRITSQLQTTSDLQSLLTLAAEQFQEALGATQTRVRLGLPTIDSDHSA